MSLCRLKAGINGSVISLEASSPLSFLLQLWTGGMRSALALAIGIGGLLFLSNSARSETTPSPAAPPPVVIELFTSQGCSSCPPADDYLRSLAKRPDILALGFHVDYWNYAGWADPFSKPEFTQRQRDYAAAFRDSYVYTPLMVVSGKAQGVGSDKQKIDQLISTEKSAQHFVVPVTLSGSPSGLKVDLAAADSGINFAPADIWLVRFEGEKRTTVSRGENRGRYALDVNIVRELVRIAEWNGDPLHFEVVLPKNSASGQWGCAILIQAPNGGPILGAAQIKWDN